MASQGRDAAGRFTSAGGGATLTVDIGPVVTALRGIDAAARDLRPVWADVVRPSLSEFFTRQFATSGSEGGTPWAPLRPSTLASKARYGRAGMGILRFTNRLWGSLVKAPSPEGLEVIEPDAYVRGTLVPYARYHQTGFTVSRWGRAVFHAAVAVPARPLVPVEMPPSYVARWAEGVAEYLRGSSGLAS